MPHRAVGDLRSAMVEQQERRRAAMEQIAALPAQGGAGRHAKAAIVRGLAEYDGQGRPTGTAFEQLVGSLALDLARRPGRAW